MELRRESGGAIGLIFGSALGMTFGAMIGELYLGIAMCGALGLIFGSCCIPQDKVAKD